MLTNRYKRVEPQVPYCLLNKNETIL